MSNLVGNPEDWFSHDAAQFIPSSKNSLPFSIMQACCDVAFKYAHDRECFGTKIGHFQVNY